MRHRFLFSVALLSMLALFRASAAAQAITGTVTNGTSGKPAAGVEVALVDPMQGMAELTKTTTGSQGRFSLKVGEAQGPRLVRASLDGVNYFRMAPPGTTTVELKVYDAAKKVDAIEGTANIIRVQADKSNLQIIQLFAINNASAPPRTLNGDNTFELALPEGAQIDGADAQAPNGQPITLAPQPLKQKDRYAFSYALKPGETRFQVAYHLPYSGQAKLSMPLLRAWNHVVIVLPMGLSWTPTSPGNFQAMPEQQAGGQNVQVATKVKAGQDVSFRVSGTGSFPEQPEEQAQGGMAGNPSSAPSHRPGGGLGPPIDAPDALAKYRWFILGGLAILLTGGAYLTVSRRPKPAPVTGVAVKLPPATPIPPNVPSAQAASARVASGGNALLEAMKEELFQLELERQRELISPEEYEKNKAALDQTLKRALSRAGKS